MADIFGILTAIENRKNDDDSKVEGYDNIPQQTNYVGAVVSLAIFAYAAYLSWTCNTRCYKFMSTAEKLFRALFAGLFGLLYLIVYFISWSAECRECKK